MTTDSLTPEVVRLKNKAKDLADEVRQEIEVLESQRTDLDVTIRELKAIARGFDPPQPRKRKETQAASKAPPSVGMVRRVVEAIQTLPQPFTSKDLKEVASGPTVSGTLKYLREVEFLGKVGTDKRGLVSYRILDADAVERDLAQRFPQ